MATKNNFLFDQMEEDKEAWKADHDEAMQCRDLEDLLSSGLTWFRLMRRSDEVWSRKVESGVAQFDEKVARQIHEMYQWWLRPCDSVLSRIEEMERQFSTVKGTQEFREARLLARSIVSLGIDEVIRSMAEAARGDTCSLEEALDGLQDSAVGERKAVSSEPAQRRRRKSS